MSVRRRIPVYPLSDYSSGFTPTSSIFVGIFEECIHQRPNRLMIHRHDCFELFFLEGEGEYFNDFEVYIIEKPSIVCVSPGQVHFWKEKGELRGPVICFTQEFDVGSMQPVEICLGSWEVIERKLRRQNALLR